MSGGSGDTDDRADDHDFTFRQIKDHPIDRFECHKGVNLISFDWIDVTHPNAEPSQIIIYFSEKDLMFFCENEVTLDVVNSIMEKIDREDDTNEMILYGFFTELIKHDTDNLERLEDEITVLEEEVVLKPQYASSKRIIYYRNITRKLRKYYDQLSIITNSLNDNENELISQDYWRHFEILDHRVDRMRNLRKEGKTSGWLDEWFRVFAPNGRAPREGERFTNHVNMHRSSFCRRLAASAFS